MEQEQAQMPPVNLVEELARREQQLESMRLAYIELQQQQGQDRSLREHIMKTVNLLPTFTGAGEVTINSFFSSTEHLLSTITNATLYKEAVRTIFYRTIQGQAKDAIINVPEPDNWQLIKETLKLRYRPNIEPHQIYKLIANLRVNSVSELIVEVQNIKYKADELTVYYRNDHYIDLSNIDSLLVNTVKEMTQGTLLDKIYEKTNITDILKILTVRRFEDSCIRPEYRKFRGKEDVAFRQNRTQNRNNYNQRTNYNSNFNQGYNQQNYMERNDFRRNNYNNNYNFDNNISRNFNNSGRYRIQNNSNNNMLNNFQKVGNPRPNSGQYRWNQPRQIEQMEVDNIEINHNNSNNSFDNRGNFQRSAQVGNPRQKFSQYRLDQPWQNQNGSMEGDSREKDNGPLAGHSEPNICQCNVGQLGQSQDQFFRTPHRIVYPR